MDLSDVIFVWGTMLGGEPAAPPTVSVSAWPHLFNKQWLRWDVFSWLWPSRSIEADAIRSARVAFVNLFHTLNSLHVQRIKEMNPSCYVIVMPDASLDMVLSHPEWMNMHRQMSLADAIGGRTYADCEVYGTLLNKPSFYLPSPIGPTEWFAPYRELPKGDYILSLDHQFAPNNTYCNVAALAAIQRETGMRIIYAAQRDQTVEYAKLARLNVEFLGHVGFKDFVALTAQARLCVDMYPSASYGRQQVLCAMVGTPCISSNEASPASVIMEKIRIDKPGEVAFVASNILEADDISYENRRRRGFEIIQRRLDFDASRKRLLGILEQIEMKV